VSFLISGHPSYALTKLLIAKSPYLNSLNILCIVSNACYKLDRF
jgi:hypothetical protein